jgi:digeranylgeranylglycerophospholipid reductase
VESFDVLVVGAGQAGCAVAEGCAKVGLSVAVLEEHPIAGKYGRCTAIISKKGLDSIGADYSSCALNRIHGAEIHASGSRLDVATKRVQAIVLDRFRFDRLAARKASRAGAKFLFRTRFESLKAVRAKDCEEYVVLARNQKTGRPVRFRCRVLVGADGANSSVARAAFFPAMAERDFAFCYEAEYSGAKVGDVGRVQVFLDSESLAGFFGWTVPCSKSVVRIGLGTTRRHELLRSKAAFFSRLQVSALLSGRPRLVREFYAMIPLRPRRRTQLGNILLVGDAAGQVKASTGGGVVFSCRAAKIAAAEIIAYVHKRKPIDYERRWRKEYGRTLSGHRAIRSVLDGLGNRSLALLLAAGRTLGLGIILERFGDMDEIFSF